jgi:anti-sigma-K factor RskA
MSDSHDCAGDAAPYVLGALDPDEARRFEEHLRTCSICQDEVASLGELTDSLAVSVPQTSAPRSLRRKVMKEVRADAARTASGRNHSRTRVGLRVAAGAIAAAIIAIVVIQVAGSNPAKVYQASVGSAQVRVADKHTELVVHHLKHLGPGHTYEVWLKGKGAPQPTNALFDVSRSGSADVHVPGDLEHINAVLVTQEPAGGSAVPTSNPVVVTPIN